MMGDESGRGGAPHGCLYSPGSAAVDPPAPRVVPSSRALRHRRLTGLSGILLFACMFLPAVKGCHEPVIPYQVPPLLPPYLYGLVFALLAMAPTPRGLQRARVALRVLGTLVVFASIVLLVVAPPVGVIELLIGTVLLVTVLSTGAIEPHIAACGVEIAVVSVLWFGAWSVTEDALLGVTLSLVSSVGLLVGCLAWLREATSRPVVEMPRAVTVARHRE